MLIHIIMSRWDNPGLSVSCRSPNHSFSHFQGEFTAAKSSDILISPLSFPDFPGNWMWGFEGCYKHWTFLGGFQRRRKIQETRKKKLKGMDFKLSLIPAVTSSWAGFPDLTVPETRIVLWARCIWSSTLVGTQGQIKTGPGAIGGISPKLKIGIKSCLFSKFGFGADQCPLTYYDLELRHRENDALSPAKDAHGLNLRNCEYVRWYSKGKLNAGGIRLLITWP